MSHKVGFIEHGFPVVGLDDAAAVVSFAIKIALFNAFIAFADIVHIYRHLNVHRNAK